MQLRCNLSSFSVGVATEQRKGGREGRREGGGKESLLAGSVDVSDGRTDGRIRRRAAG